MSAPYSDAKPIVLIAEDDLDDKLLLEMAFRDFGNSLEVEFVKDGEELLAHLRGQETGSHLGLILLDLNMPKIDGRQALLEIKGRADLKDIPIVIWTTSNEDEDRTFCAEKGAAEFITKPVDFPDLESAVKRLVKTWLAIPPQL